MRQYAANKLDEAGELERIRDRHLVYFRDLTEEAEPHVWRSDYVTWLNRLEVEHDNMRAALAWSQTPRERVQSGLRLAGALAAFWLSRSKFDEGRQHLSLLLTRPEASVRTAARARALSKAGLLAYIQSDYSAARPQLDESLSIFRVLGPAGRRGVAGTLIRLGDLEFEVGNYVMGARWANDSLEIMRELNDKRGVARALWLSGFSAVRRGEFEEANRDLEEALALWHQIGDKQSIALVQSILAEVMLRGGDYERAFALEEDSLALRREAHNNWGIAVSLGNLAWVALRRGDLERAANLLGESLVLRRDIDDIGGIAWCLEKSVEVNLTQGQQESRPARKRCFRRAAQLMGAAASLRAPINSAIDLLDKPRHERHIAMTRSDLGEQAFSAAWSEGQALNIEQAIDVALETQIQ